MLYVRMVLYALSAGLAGYGVATFDPTAGTLTIQLDELAKIVTGIVGFIGTFAASRIAKKNGGAT